MSETVRNRLLPRNTTFSQATEAVLREMVLDGTLAPGERINEVLLATQLGISRGPLREAIQRLASEGLLTVVSHRGAFVRTFSRQDVVDLYELRCALELHAVRLACERAADSDLDDLDALLTDTAVRIRTSSAHAYPQEPDFHLRLVLLAGNQALLRAAQDVQRQLALARSMSAKQPARARVAVAEHAELVTVLRGRDAAEATRMMGRHLDHSLDSALSALGLPADGTAAPPTEPE
jgi:DNA-binding GntR family transcriptional regulator